MTRPGQHGEDWARRPAGAVAAALVLVCSAVMLGYSLQRSKAGNQPGAELGSSAIDLNSASAASLEALPGVGPKRAAAIVAHRAANGPFRAVDDLDAVAGIGARTLDRLRPFLFVPPVNPDAPGADPTAGEGSRSRPE